MPTIQKERAVHELSELMDSSKGAILTDYRGLTVAEITELRKRLRDAEAEYHVVKNTLFKRAIHDGESLHPFLEGPTAIAFALKDPVAPTKVVLDFIREKRKAAVKAGWIDGRVYDEDALTALSKLPPREILMAQLLGAIEGPIADLIGAIDGVAADLANTIQAIADQKKEAA